MMILAPYIKTENVQSLKHIEPTNRTITVYPVRYDSCEFRLEVPYQSSRIVHINHYNAVLSGIIPVSCTCTVPVALGGL